LEPINASYSRAIELVEVLEWQIEAINVEVDRECAI
jgi:hypothetical protein